MKGFFRRLRVLNAFRHHRNSHTCSALLSKGLIRGAQRLSASSEFSLSRRRWARCSSQVLNAFRHHRNSHLLGGNAVARAIMCSTPFGIIGILTGVTFHVSKENQCAQRLSASSEFSRPPPQRSCQRRNQVLNAFRHHRNSHAAENVFRIAELLVLNAFRHHRNSHGPSQILTRRHLAGAQRLSASSEFSLRWFQSPCLLYVASWFSGISSFCSHNPSLQC